MKDLIDILPILQKYGVLFICSLFGFLARESYNCLREEEYKFKKVIPKVTLGFFICIVTLPFLEEISIVKRTFPIPILLLSFMYMDIANFINKDLITFLVERYSKKIP